MTSWSGTLTGVGVALAFVACAKGVDQAPPDSTAPVAAAVQTAADSALARADSLYLERDIDGARAIWIPALGEAEARGDSARSAILLTSLGLAHRSLGEYTQARELLERSLALKQRLDMQRDLFRSLNALGLLAGDEGRLSEATAFYQQASEVARANRDSLSAAKALHNQGLVFHRLGDFERARTGVVSLQDVARALGDSASLARALNNVAMLDVALGNTLSAIDALDEVRRIARASGDVELQENALGQLALAHDALGDPSRAFALMDSALALTRQHGMRRQEAENLRLLGDLYLAAGDYLRALDYYVKSRAIGESLGLTEETGDVILSEAEAQFALGQTELARQRATAALRIHRAGGLRFAELGDLTVLAEMTQASGLTNEANSYLRSARVLAGTMRADFVMTDIALAEARVADRAGDSRRVLGALESTPVASASGGEWEAHALRARAYARLGRLEVAAAAGRQALAGVERIRGGYPAGALRTFYASAKANVYADQVLVLLRLGRSAEAFEVADGGRGRALVEHLAVAQEDVRRSAGVARSMVEAERLLRRIDTLVARLREAQQTRSPERSVESADDTSLGNQLAAARREYETWLERAAREDAAGSAILGGTRTDAAAVRRSLAPEEALLEYIVTDERLLVFVVTRDSVRSVTIDVGAHELANRVRLARELVARRDGNVNQGTSVLRALYRILLRDALALLPAGRTERLLIVPHQTLAYLPFAALLDEATGEHLVERFTLLQLPTASVLPALRSSARRSAGPAPLRSFALAPFPDALPATRGEASQFLRAVRPADALIGARATEAALRNALGRGGIVHVATHGVMNAKNPMFSRLELAVGSDDEASDDDGRFEVHELLGLAVQSPLIFLSGCETSLGPAWSTSFDRTDDYTTLAQAFLFAGARNVVGTLWRITDESAARFAEFFYGALESRPAPDAVAIAQRRMLRDARFNAPYYWAGYQVSGDGIGGAERTSISSRR